MDAWAMDAWTMDGGMHNPRLYFTGAYPMNPRRFRLKVADHIGMHGTMGEVRAINEVASNLGWIDAWGGPSLAAPVWLDRYRELVAYRDMNLPIATNSQERAAHCSAQLEALADAHA